MKPHLTSLLILLLTATVAAGAGGWSTESDPKFGFVFAYPQDLFASVDVDSDRPAFHYFASESDEAKFLVGAWDNRSGQTPKEFKRWMLANADGYEDITYQPHGRSWFVVSGYRGNQIYYEKLMFSCGGSIANVLAISYPAARRDPFDRVVERMEDRFRPGRC